MRLVSFRRPDGSAGFGVLSGDAVKDCTAATPHADLRAVLAAGDLPALAAAEGPMLDLADLSLLPPVPNPDKILCIGLNYLTHIKETGRETPKHPSIFTRYPSSLRGHGADLIRPKASEKFDYEGELAIVIGKPGRHIDPADAMDHVAGYSCFNDGSIRDFQAHTSQFWPGKSFDDSGSMGPALVTVDEVPDIGASALSTRVNGQEVQASTIDDLAIGIPQIIAYCSTVTRLLPGDVIATGTPGGVGKFRTPPLYLKPGDVCEVEIAGIGLLRNGVADEA